MRKWLRAGKADFWIFLQLLAAAMTVRVAGLHGHDQAARPQGLQLGGWWGEAGSQQPGAPAESGVPAGRKARPQRGPAALWGVTGAGEGEFYTRWATGQNVLAVTAASSELLGLCPRG